MMNKPSGRDLIISLMSFNMGNAQIDFLEEIFSQSEYNPDADLFVFGLQESTFSSVSSTSPLKNTNNVNEKTNKLQALSNKDSLNADIESLIIKALGDDFYKVIFH